MDDRIFQSLSTILAGIIVGLVVVWKIGLVGMGKLLKCVRPGSLPNQILM